jgi:hypothetical protein
MPAILALLDLRDPGNIVDLDVLVNLTGDSIASKVKDHDTYMATRWVFKISIDFSLTGS